MIPTTAIPTATPTTVLSTRVLPVLDGVVDDPTLLRDLSTVQGAAAEWVRWENQIPLVDDGKIVQRYAMVLLDMAASASDGASRTTVADPLLDECSWDGASCAKSVSSSGNGTGTFDRVVSIAWFSRGFTGMIPSEIELLTTITYLDLAENQLTGSIPDSLYQLTELDHLFLHQNRLHGSLTTAIGQLSGLVKLYLGNNFLTGTIPAVLGELDSNNQLKPLEWLSLYNNSFVGSIPQTWNLTQLYYLDLGRNELTGKVPDTTFTNGMPSLKSLYLDYNGLTGQLPRKFPDCGSGELQQIVVNDNLFTGEVSGKFRSQNYLATVEIQNNMFQRLDRTLCKQIIFAGGGQITTFHADCDICQCDYFCGVGQCFS
jgi:hypothetical protein